MFFELMPQEAERSAKTIAETLSKHWKQALRNEGASPGDIFVYADAFERAEAEFPAGFNLTQGLLDPHPEPAFHSTA